MFSEIKNVDSSHTWNDQRVAGGRPTRSKPTGTDMFAKATWEAVSRAMRKLKVRRKDLTKATGISKASISMWANWTRAPKLPMIVRVAEHLDLDVTKLVKLKPQPPALDGLRRLDDDEEQLVDLFERNEKFRFVVRELIEKYGKD